MAVHFLMRAFPSANSVLIEDERNVLVDTGFGSMVESLITDVEQTGVRVENIHQIINTHAHSDHVGGNHRLQGAYRIPIAAHVFDADLVNYRHPETGCARWLEQPIEAYTIERPLVDGDIIQTGQYTWTVLHTPGHAQGHITLYEPTEEILICGDLFQYKDVGWQNLFREGIACVSQSIQSLERLSKLSIKVAYPGHGPAIEQPHEMIALAKKRVQSWLAEPEKLYWHACKRIFSFTLIMKDGMSIDEVKPYLQQIGWCQDIAKYGFRQSTEVFSEKVLNEMLRSGAATLEGDRLKASTPYVAAEWLPEKAYPDLWEK